MLLAVGILAAYLAAQRPPEYSVERLADNLVVIKDGNDAGHGPVMSWQQFVDNVASLEKRQ